MTFTFPDIASYQAGINLVGMKAVLIKATESTGYTNPDYGRASASARSLGIPWAAYHFLHHTNGAGQADHFHSVAGNAPCMLDVETAGDGTKATVQDCLDFSNRLLQLGGHVRLVYFPHWYWQELGSPSLVPLAQAGMHLISSDYTSYSDSGPGWAAYGGVTPTIWQYTDAFPFNGFSVDMNAFRGSVDDLRNLLSGGEDVTLAQDPDGQWMFPRIQAMAHLNKPTGGPEVGQTLEFVTWTENVTKALNTLVTQGQPVALTDAQVQQIGADLVAGLDYDKLAAALATHFKVQ